MCELLFILQRISVTSIILSNNVYDQYCLSVVALSLILNHLYMDICFVFVVVLFYFLFFSKFNVFILLLLFCLLVLLNGIKKYLA